MTNLATRAREISRFSVPVRTHELQARDNSIHARLALADRIADLPRIQAVDHEPAGGWRNVEVLLMPLVSSARKRRPPALLCHIGADGIVLYGLSNSERAQVLSHGWGQLFGDNMLLFLPRDDQELETVWRILRRAYESLVDASAAAVPVGSARFGVVPNSSRTNLQ